MQEHEKKVERTRRYQKPRKTVKFYGIAGKTKQRDEQMYVYREDMTRHKIEEDWDPFILEWTSDIFQKIVNTWSGIEK